MLRFESYTGGYFIEKRLKFQAVPKAQTWNTAHKWCDLLCEFHSIGKKQCEYSSKYILLCSIKKKKKHTALELHEGE